MKNIVLSILVVVLSIFACLKFEENEKVNGEIWSSRMAASLVIGTWECVVKDNQHVLCQPGRRDILADFYDFKPDKKYSISGEEINRETATSLAKQNRLSFTSYLKIKEVP